MRVVYLEEFPNIVKRNQIVEDNDYEQHPTTTETAPARTNLGGNQGFADRAAEENPSSGARNSANDEPRSAGTGAETGRDSDQALTSYTEAEVRQREQRAAASQSSLKMSAKNMLTLRAMTSRRRAAFVTLVEGAKSTYSRLHGGYMSLKRKKPAIF